MKSETKSFADESDSDGSNIVEVPIKTLRDFLVAIAKKTTEMIIEEANQSKKDFSRDFKPPKEDGVKS